MEYISLAERDMEVENYCPCCGVHNHGISGEVVPCKHLLFIYHNASEPCVLFMREDVGELMNDVEEDDEQVHLIELDIDNGFIFAETGSLTGTVYLIGYQYADLGA